MGGLRQVLVTGIGEEKYKGIIGIFALIGFGLIIWGYIRAPFQNIREPDLSLNYISIVLMYPSVVIFVSSTIRSNIKRIVRHPQLTGLGLFALAHLLVSGDLASILLFSSFLVFSVIAFISAIIRQLETERNRHPAIQDLKVVFTGTVIYGLLFFIHPWLFGVPVLMLPV
jgi:uncharacterized membrane protein